VLDRRETLAVAETLAEPTEVDRIWLERMERLVLVLAEAVFLAYCLFWDLCWAAAVAAA